MKGNQEARGYALCPRCPRAVPRRSGEQFCSNDGVRLIVGCPVCGAGVRSPYAQHCHACGAALRGTAIQEATNITGGST